jgi:hypothetical protein
MKFLDVRSVALHEIQYDEPLRTSEPRVHDLARSLKVHGLIQFPVVDSTTMRVVSGRDRIAAHLINNEAMVEVRMVDGTAEELEALEVAENLERRHDDRNALRARYVAILERAIAAKGIHVDESTTIAQRGRPKTAHTKAVEAVAELEGVKPAMVRRSEAKVKAAAEPPKAPAPPEPRAEDRAVAEYNEAIVASVAAIGAAARTLAVLAAHDWLPSARAKRTRDELKLLAKVLDSETLVGECPCCPERGVLPRCGVCNGTHYVTEFQLAGAPKP